MFKKVVAVAKLHKKDFKSVDKTPYNYDKKPFCLDGNIFSFSDRTIKIDVYTSRWMPLLLSEGVCRH